ncbi:hypothetical protein ACLKA7_005553 [Drosophila subpalustris]
MYRIIFKNKTFRHSPLFFLKSTESSKTTTAKSFRETSHSAVLNSQATGTAAVARKPTKKEGSVGQRNSPFSNKRHRLDDSAKASDSKRLRPEGSLASLRSKPELQVVIIDKNDPKGKITVVNRLKLKENIKQALHDTMCRSVNPLLTDFDGIKWFKGAKTVAWANEDSLRFLKDTMHSVGELRPGAQI